MPASHLPRSGPGPRGCDADETAGPGEGEGTAFYAHPFAEGGHWAGLPSGAGEGLETALWIGTLPLKLTVSVWVLAALHLSSVPANVHRDFPVKCG